MNFKFVTLASCLLLGYSIQPVAGELDINPSISASLIRSQNNSVRFEESDASILSIKPSLSTSYNSKYWVGSLSVDHSQIQSDTTNGSQGNSFTNYQYSSDIFLIEDILSVRLAGGQSYRSILASQYFVNDPFLGGDDLSKTQNNAANLLFNIAPRKYFGLNVNAGLSKVKSDRSSDIDPVNDISAGLENELDNENKSLQMSFYQGREFSQLSWNITASHQNTVRTDRNDLTSRLMRGDIGLGLFSNVRLVLTGQSEENDLVNNAIFSNQDGNYDSYGAGLSWDSGTSRSFRVTYNRANRSATNEKENFVAIDLNWRFTSRTSVQASIGKRFFGDSGNFSLTHNTKHLRTQIGYTETVTTFSRLITNPEDQGVFVCPENASSFGDCILPPNLSNELQPGEESSNLLVQIPEISEEAILRKSLNARFGLSGKRTTSALNFRHTNTESLESIKNQNTDVISLNNSFKANNRTSFNLSLSYASTDEESTGIKTETISSSFGISRQLGQKMSANLDFRYLDRSSTNADLDLDLDLDFINQRNSDLTDRRLTLEFVYDF